MKGECALSWCGQTSCSSWFISRWQ